MNLDSFYAIIGKNVKRCRVKAGLTQEALAEKSGLSLDYIGKIEVNINKPGLKALLKISKALNISPAEFFKNADD